MQIEVYEPAPAPPHLSPSARHRWETTVDRYELEEHHLRLLQLCCEAWDRGQAAREQLAKDGLISNLDFRLSKVIAEQADTRHAIEQKRYKFAQDYTFTSLSSAASVLLARSANGRIEWKDSTGKLLKDLQEESLDSFPDEGTP